MRTTVECIFGYNVKPQQDSEDNIFAGEEIRKGFSDLLKGYGFESIDLSLYKNSVTMGTYKNIVTEFANLAKSFEGQYKKVSITIYWSILVEDSFKKFDPKNDKINLESFLS